MLAGRYQIVEPVGGRETLVESGQELAKNKVDLGVIGVVLGKELLNLAPVLKPSTVGGRHKPPSPPNSLMKGKRFD